MDTDGFKKGATYNAIRDWIKEKYGCRVTNLNIAQVKQKHGIIELENYNKPELPDSKQPGCPKEKVQIFRLHALLRERKCDTLALRQCVEVKSWI